MQSFIKAVVLLVAAPLTAANAYALEGRYTAPTGTQVEFCAGGDLAVDAAGLSLVETYIVDGETLTIASTAPNSPCPDTTGVYTVSESETGVSFILIEDDCDIRAADLTSGEWTRTR